MGNKRNRFWILKEASNEVDWDTLEEALDEMLDNFDFIEEDSGGVFLSQRDYGSELVDYYEYECGENPQWFKERLHHVPNHVWTKRGLGPPQP